MVMCHTSLLLEFLHFVRFGLKSSLVLHKLHQFLLFFTLHFVLRPEKLAVSWGETKLPDPWCWEDLEVNSADSKVGNEQHAKSFMKFTPRESNPSRYPYVSSASYPKDFTEIKWEICYDTLWREKGPFYEILL